MRRVPAIIAVPLDPAGSAAQIDATAVEIGRKLKQAKARREHLGKGPNGAARATAVPEVEVV